MKTLLALVVLLAGVPAFGAPPPGSRGCVLEGLNGHLKKIIIPRIELRNATVEEALELVRKLAKEADPNGVGVNIVYKKDVAPVLAAAPAATKAAAPARK